MSAPFKQNSPPSTYTEERFVIFRIPHFTMSGLRQEKYGYLPTMPRTGLALNNKK